MSEERNWEKRTLRELAPPLGLIPDGTKLSGEVSNLFKFHAFISITYKDNDYELYCPINAFSERQRKRLCVGIQVLGKAKVLKRGKYKGETRFVRGTILN